MVEERFNILIIDRFFGESRVAYPKYVTEILKNWMEQCLVQYFVVLKKYITLKVVFSKCPIVSHFTWPNLKFQYTL